MKSVALHNLGCKVNGYEMDVMQQMLQEKGYQIVTFDNIADIYIINTCTVTNIADRKSRQMIHRAKKRNPKAVVVAAGCYVQTGREEALKDSGIDLAVGNNRKKDLISILEEFLAGRAGEEEKKEEEEKTHKEKNADNKDGNKKTLYGKSIIDINNTNEYESMMLTHTTEHTRAFIKIQDGCNQFCSYCIIPYARGRVRSRSQKEILKEVKGLSEAGCREVVLTGIHLSSYGMDFDGIGNIPQGSPFPGERLLTLIEEINRLEGISRIRLGSLEPRIITEAFAEKLSSMEKICPHFHLSLQSGSDTVLARMNRKYTSGEYYEKVCILRKYFENPAVTTDVIVGFPGESEEEYRQTAAFLEKTGFYEMHIFKYSMRKNTAAAAMENQVPDEIKARRSDELIKLADKLSAAYREKFLHKETAVLFEEEKVIGNKKYQIGHSREYIKAAAESEENLSGKILKGKFSDFLQPDILIFQS